MPYAERMRDATGEVHVYRPASSSTRSPDPPEFPHPDAPLTVNGSHAAGWGIHPCDRKPLAEWRAGYIESVGHAPEDDDEGHPVSGDETTRLSWCQCWDDQITRYPEKQYFTGGEPCEEPTCPHPQPHAAGSWMTRDRPEDGPRGVFPWFRDIAHVLYPDGVLPVPVRDECGYCTPPGSARCRDRYDGMVCTRDPGHDGDHVACGGIHHSLGTWPATADPMPEPRTEPQQLSIFDALATL